MCVARKRFEFLELKQGNSTVVDYGENFREMVKLCSHYNSIVVGGLKCIKFESGLRPEIKQVVGYQEIRRFYVRVSK